VITHRVQIWEQADGKTVLSRAAKPHINRLPCLVKTYTLAGGGKLADVAVFPMNRPPIALISQDAPNWAEPAIAQFFDGSGKLKGGAK